MSVETETQQVELTEDELIERVASEMAQRRGAAPPGPPEPPKDEKPAPVAESAPPADAPQPEPESAGAPQAKPADEPFPGYKDLSDDLRAQFDRLRQDLDKTRQDYGALYNRLAPTQRELDRARGELQRYQEQLRQPQAQQPQAVRQPEPEPQPVTQDLRAEVDRWLKRQSPERQEYFKQFPEEAMTAFEIAHGVVNDILAQREKEFETKIQSVAQRAEYAELAARHPDYSQYAAWEDPKTRKTVFASQDAADFWSWVNRQPDNVYALANSAKAVDISEALSLYKWERENPQFGETLALPEFQRWAGAMPRRLTEMLGSTDVNERRFVLAQFWRDYEEATGAKAPQPVAPPSPDSQRAAELAARREKQAQRTAPSFRGAPTGTPGRTGEDAEIEAAYQQMKAREQARRAG